MAAPIPGNEAMATTANPPEDLPVPDLDPAGMILSLDEQGESRGDVKARQGCLVQRGHP